ncbi:MAG: hypothetical protein AAFX92_09370 [Pseudomonadota bacterium]
MLRRPIKPGVAQPIRIAAFIAISMAGSHAIGIDSLLATGDARFGNAIDCCGVVSTKHSRLLPLCAKTALHNLSNAKSPGFGVQRRRRW